MRQGALAREILVGKARGTVRLGSRSFYMASRLLDRRTRELVWLLYAWCRYCDDRCDGQILGQNRNCPTGTLQELQAATIRALAGEPSGEPAFDALACVTAECAIPPRYVFDHLAGFALDFSGWRPQDAADLIRYCYHVAGTVGCMLAIIMGIDPADKATLACASHLGTAFQLCNIARDVREDHAAGRCYLPTVWLQQYGLDPKDPLRPDRREALVMLIGRIVALAEQHERWAWPGMAELGFRSRWAIVAATGIYGEIGRRVAGLGPKAWERRVVVSPQHKLTVLVSAFGQALAS